MTNLGPAIPPVSMGTYQDWLVAWKEWARTRKRGKMAQFIVDKLEENVRRSKEKGRERKRGRGRRGRGVEERGRGEGGRGEGVKE